MMRAVKREARLFPPGYWSDPVADEAQIRESKLRAALNLRKLAARGLNRRKYLKEAEKLEREAQLTSIANRLDNDRVSIDGGVFPIFDANGDNCGTGRVEEER